MVNFLVREIGGPETLRYQAEYRQWHSKGRKRQREIYEWFVADTGSAMDYETFCWGYFTETHQGERAFRRHLRPLLDRLNR